MSHSSAPDLAPHRVQTVNISVHSDNKIHDDATAARYGFRGGLVAGTLMYGHLSTPLVQLLGARWLDHSVSEVKLLQPAYDGEWLTVEGQARRADDDAEGYRLAVRNEAGTELATLETQLPEALPPLDPRAHMRPAAPGQAPVPISWDAVHVDEPMQALHWRPSREDHERWCDAAGDRLPLFRAGERPRIQPGRVLQGANEVLRNHFRLNPWIHAGSHIVHRAPLHLGDPVEIRAMPIEKWERKGHEFLRLYVVFLNDGLPAVEVLHSAIFKVRPAGP